VALELWGRGVVPGRCRAPALVSSEPISFLGGVDPESGVVVKRGHPLEGRCVRGKVLCFPHGSGSTVGSYVIYALARRGLAPSAIVNREADPIVVVGAIIAEIPMVVGVEVSRIRTGDLVEVDGERGLVRILSGGREACT